MKGIVLKVTYNDGGAAGGLLGFQGVCSKAVMQMNVEEGKGRFCSTESPCRAFVENGFKGQRPEPPVCYESDLFARSPWKFGGGMILKGKNKGKWKRIPGLEKGDIVFLSTRRPGTQEASRLVFGCFRLAKAPYLDQDWGYVLESDRTMEVCLPDEVALVMYFWHLYSNRDGSVAWGSHLHRHLLEDQTEEVLQCMVAALDDHPEKDVLLLALGEHFVQRPVRSPKKPTGGGRGGGESKEHRRLKNHVARHPEAVGLPRKTRATKEHPYLSGDQVDVKFDLPDGTAAVVEVETVCPLPGAHQCIKYRALQEAQMGFPVESGKVQAILVAYEFDGTTRQFADEYDIRLVEMQPR